MSLSRRQFIQASGLMVCASGLPAPAQAKGKQNALPIPPLLESRRGQPLFLTMQRAHWAFSGDRKTSVWGVNGRYLGPTVKVFSGDDVKLIYGNRLNEPVSMTVSGLQVPGPLMGGAGRMISPGTDWAPVLPIRQAAATCWYHANTPNRMAPHVYQGLAGLWLIEDSASKSLPIPNHYGVDDFPLIIQDKRLDNFGVPVYNPPSSGGFVGDTLLVNGIQEPFVEVSRGWVRLRLLNASNARRYVMRLSDGRPMYLIASDLGFLPLPLALNQISLAPGERREILIDMSQGGEVTLAAGDAATLMERLRGLFEPSSILVSTQILTLKPTGLLPLVTNNLPARLLTDIVLPANISRTREFRLGDSLPGINGAMWDMTRTDVQTQEGRCERWIIHADSPQPFHIQGAMFLVRSINGAAPAADQSGWKDTVWVDGDAELLVYFTQSSSASFPFLYYSHTLEMADRGSTGQLVVQ
ncbi:cell division protein FtsP [Symbiopectobacterium purcellii]|uniref:Cell division protein FtsP n=1 Tax=Symbiopectobacterium purcellii TaxID=2871826 RepID=A0ABX9AQZ6_9ENTR|nr:cell division protein FtsP [Symbiopectobacterium purcellii]QZN96195.1 cell division protein FtsP [Symbiopectobacterium purcellii]